MDLTKASSISGSKDKQANSPPGKFIKHQKFDSKMQFNSTVIYQPVLYNRL
jgi:hypothetical protein